MEKPSGAMWRESLVSLNWRRRCQFFCKSHDSRNLVGHHDRTGAVLCITKNGVVRGKSWTRQTLSDAWESTNWEGLCGTPWQMVAPEVMLTKKVTADKEGAGPPLPRIGLWTMKLTDTLEPAQAVQRLHRMEKRQSHIMMNAESKSEQSCGWTGLSNFFLEF